MWVLDQQVYHQITTGVYIQDHKEVMQFLKNNEKLNIAGEAVLQIVANLLKTEFYHSGHVIVKQGDTGKLK